MAKYIISSKYSSNFSVQNYAGTKAPLDVENIAIGMGFERMFFKPKKNQIIQQLSDLCFIMKCILMVKTGDVVLFQYPCIPPLLKALICLFNLRNINLIALIHDLDNVRYYEGLKQSDIRTLNVCKHIIAHTEAMKQLLVNNGIKSNIEILGCFDYLVTKANTMERHMSNDICFAGNPNKSPFIQHLGSNMNDVHFICYGSKPSYDLASCCEYAGRFDANDVSAIRGSWGLVWDGDSIDALEGQFGKYQRYIAPHKFSLYLCCGIPVIVSSESAMAHLVKSSSIGLCVSSLQELPDILSSITEEEFQNILNNVKIYSEKVQKGEQTKNSFMRLNII